MNLDDEYYAVRLLERLACALSDAEEVANASRERRYQLGRLLRLRPTGCYRR